MHKGIPFLMGVCSYKVFKKGNLIYEDTGHNKIVNLGRRTALELLANADVNGLNKHVNKLSFGSNPTPSTSEDTQIATPYTKFVNGWQITEQNELIYDWSLESEEANGSMIYEIGLTSHDGTLFARKVTHEPIDKDTDISLEGQWKIMFLSPNYSGELVYGFAPGTDPEYVKKVTEAIQQVMNNI